MSAVNLFYECTQMLIILLEKKSDASDRDIMIEAINELLEKRQALVVEIVEPFTEEERRLGKVLIELNNKLDQLLHSEKQAIQKDIKELNMKKKSNEKYTNPYQNLATDGMFYDKKN